MIGTLAPATSTFLPVRTPPYSRRSTCRASVHVAPPPPSTCQRSGSLYEVLRVDRKASTVEIKAAYRNLAKVYHPDSSLSGSSDGRDFIQIREAYSTLSDPTAREIYDLKLSVGSARQPSGSGFGSGYYRTRRWETDQCW